MIQLDRSCRQQAMDGSTKKDHSRRRPKHQDNASEEARKDSIRNINRLDRGLEYKQANGGKTT